MDTDRVTQPVFETDAPYAICLSLIVSFEKNEGKLGAGTGSSCEEPHF